VKIRRREEERDGGDNDDGGSAEYGERSDNNGCSCADER
jgi:hypothetical protein